MNARRDSPSEPPRGSFGGRLLLTAAVLFALGATGTLILTDEQKWLKLGIVAALWAALAGAFVAARYRRQVSDQEDVLAERHERYQLELEREIAARREYELEAAAEARRQADEESRDHVAALRQELFGLRQTLESLLGGEFLVERYALRAESTRMRSLPDDRELKRLPPATSVVPDAQTELIEPVGKPNKSGKRKVEPLPRRTDHPAGRAPRPGKPPVVEAGPEQWQQVHSAELSDRWFVPDGLGTDQPSSAQPKSRQPTGTRRNTVTSGYADPVGGPRAGPNGHNPADPTPSTPTTGRPVSSDFGPAATHNDFGSGSAESSGYGLGAGRSESSGFGPAVGRNGSGFGPGSAEPSGFGPTGRNGSAGRPESSGYTPPVSRADASGFGPGAGRAESSGYGPAAGRAEVTSFGPGAGRAESSGYGTPVTRAEASGYRTPMSRSDASGYGTPVTRPEASGYGTPVTRAEASGYRTPMTRPEASGYGPPASRNAPPGPAGAAQSSAYGPAVNRAETSGYGPAVSRAETGYPTPTRPPQQPADTGGRRRRAEGQPTWQESRNAQPRPDTPEAEPSGSHAAGRSVSELLASHGGTGRPPTPRRRRRKE